MRNRALIVILFGVMACGAPAQNRVQADTAALPYEAPDVNEIAGIDPD